MCGAVANDSKTYEVMFLKSLEPIFGPKTNKKTLLYLGTL